MIEKYSGELNNPDKHLSNAVITAYIILKENLSSKEISFIEKHLSKCDGCSERLNEMIAEDAEIDDFEITGLQDYNIKRLKRENNKYFIWAAAAMLIIAIGIGMFYFFQPEDTKVIVEDETETVDSLVTEEIENGIEQKEEEKTEDEKKEYNQSDFAVNNVLENFINRNVRSDSRIKVLSPEIGDTLDTPIEFEWEINTAGTLTIELVDNKNKLMVKQTLADNNYAYQNNLKPGLYYWKVLINNKLEAVGKFYIE